VKLVTLIVVTIAFTACASSSAQVGKVDKPVIIDQPDAKSRLALQNAISKALGASYVVLADDALTRENTIIIEPTRVRNFEGQRLQGRETRMPEKFHLVRGKKKDECVLVFDRTGVRTTLVDAHCKEK
jgi:hypothetical protein